MLIALTATEKHPGAMIDRRFGRTGALVVWDGETGCFSYIDNRHNLNAAQGAGIQTAQNVVETGAEILITGHCGPKAFRVLSAAGIRVFTVADVTINEAIRALGQDTLKRLETSDVEGHWV